MILSFATKGTQDIFEVVESKLSRKTLPMNLHKIAKRKLNMLAVATHLSDLKSPPANHLEPLKGDLQGFYSIRINAQWRIVFIWRNNNAEQVEILDYH